MPENTLLFVLLNECMKKKISRFQKKSQIKFTSLILHSVHFLNTHHQTVCGDILPLIGIVLQMFNRVFFCFFGFGCLLFPCLLRHHLVLGSQRFIYFTVNRCMNQKWFIETISSPYYMYAYIINILKIFYLKTCTTDFFWSTFSWHWLNGSRE